MIKTGIDTVDISRFRDMSDLKAFKDKVFTQREQECLSAASKQYQSIAGAFAAKEAFVKYLGTGFLDIKLHDIEVLHNSLGKPYICYKGIKIDADLSISHSDTIATAIVCGEDTAFLDYIEGFDYYRSLLPARNPDMHKGDAGRVLVVSGSAKMSGAARLCSMSALRSGSGLVTVGTPECVQSIVASANPEAMVIPLPEDNGVLSEAAIPIIIAEAQRSDAVAVGPGLSNTNTIKKMVHTVLQGSVPCVLDADALNSISDDVSVLKSKKCEVVITPHSAEMSRLCGISIDEIKTHREEIALSFAREYSCTVVLKGHHTVVASPNGDIKINKSGNDGMASGGMGDVLTGIITSFIGQGVPVYESAVLGVFLHGLSGDIASKKIGKFSLLASDVIATLAQAIIKLSN